MKRLIWIVVVMLILATPALADNTQAPPADPYKKVSTLVALPDFIPGMGTLYVQPTTLPVGPFLAYNREGTLVATIYMVPVNDLKSHSDFIGLATGTDRVEQVDLTFNAGHPGVEVPHYHVTLWHVNPAKAAVK